MANDQTIEVALNLLIFREAHGRLSTTAQPNPGAEDILRFLCPPDEPDATRVVPRYREIAARAVGKIAVLPAEREILRKMILPLRASIGSYMVGNYLGTISLCGAVCEMLAIFWYDLAGVRCAGAIMDEVAQRKLYGHSFEELGQSRRISIMRATGLIDDNIERLFRVTLNVRRDYIHYFSKEQTDIASDAREVFKATCDLMAVVFRCRFEDGKLILDPTLTKYLKKAAENSHD
jgi:hypothetical protein